MKNSPTSPPIVAHGHLGAENSSVAIAEGRRGNVPRLFVLVPDGRAYRGSRYVSAHLRNKRGYLELCWRDGKRVKTVHLGKAANSSPTRRRGPGGRRRPGPRRRRRGARATV